MKKIICILLAIFSVSSAFCLGEEFYKTLRILVRSYPDEDFTASYEKDQDDFSLEFTNPSGKKVKLYFCNGSFLPLEELKNKDKYWPVIYEYSNELKDPALMTESEREQLKEFSSRQNRRNGKGSPMFLFDGIYNSESQAKIEPLIVQTTFLGKRTRVHKKILEHLKNVEAEIYRIAKTDNEVKIFIDKVKSADAYHWRLIDGTPRKSFHSLGIAIDILPVRITGEIFWSWARDKNPSEWMLTPLSRRWMPPKKVIDAFEKEGFIWGGNWAIWDNMHFEYHPELLKN